MKRTIFTVLLVYSTKQIFTNFHTDILQQNENQLNFLRAFGKTVMNTQTKFDLYTNPGSLRLQILLLENTVLSNRHPYMTGVVQQTMQCSSLVSSRPQICMCEAKMREVKQKHYMGVSLGESE